MEKIILSDIKHLQLRLMLKLVIDKIHMHKMIDFLFLAKNFKLQIINFWDKFIILPLKKNSFFLLLNFSSFSDKKNTGNAKDQTWSYLVENWRRKINFFILELNYIRLAFCYNWNLNDSVFRAKDYCFCFCFCSTRFFDFSNLVKISNRVLLL